ncbi:MAG TPA: hypothetical protein EYQ83_16060 [Acidobacteria bacterium]|nr:hypothetical protein [Acidobacteriota bacterium]
MNKGRGAAVAVIAAATVSLDLLAHPHGEMWWHHAPGFDLVFGFVGCAVIVVVSKAFGKAGLQRPERFYDDAEKDSTE